MKCREARIPLPGIFLLLVTGSCLELGDECQTPSRVDGRCINLPNCPPLVNALQTKPVPVLTLELYRKSLCGFHGIDALVCCPMKLPSAVQSVSEPSPTQTEVTEDVTGYRNSDLLNEFQCGPLFDVDRLLVDHGNTSKLSEFPWIALLAYSGKNGRPFRCAGSIINERYVLTAAHCVKFLPRNIQLNSVRLGEHNMESEIDCQEHNDHDVTYKTCAPAPQDFDIEEVIPHPDYTGRPNHLNDIALVRLSRDANLSTEYVHPICFPMGLPQQTDNLDGKRFLISGWMDVDDRLSPILLRGYIQGISLEECASSFKNIAIISSKSQFCGVSTKGSNCLGDNGGPLASYGMVRGRRRIIQYGIVSYGFKKCEAPAKPAVYTRVGHFMKWILDNIRP